MRDVYEIDTSAAYGVWYMVSVTYNTEHDGAVVNDDERNPPRTLHGPFHTKEAAERWADARDADGDMEVVDIDIWDLNRVQDGDEA